MAPAGGKTRGRAAAAAAAAAAATASDSKKDNEDKPDPYAYEEAAAMEEDDGGGEHQQTADDAPPQQQRGTVADAAELRRLVARLKPGAGKDALIKALKPLVGALEQAPQGAERALAGEGPAIAEALSQRGLLPAAAAGSGGEDPSLRLYAALATAQMLRVYAPETPFGDEDMKVRHAV